MKISTTFNIIQLFYFMCIIFIEDFMKDLKDLDNFLLNLMFRLFEIIFYKYHIYLYN